VGWGGVRCEQSFLLLLPSTALLQANKPPTPTTNIRTHTQPQPQPHLHPPTHTHPPHQCRTNARSLESGGWHRRSVWLATTGACIAFALAVVRLFPFFSEMMGIIASLGDIMRCAGVVAVRGEGRGEGKRRGRLTNVGGEKSELQYVHDLQRAAGRVGRCL